MGRTVTACVVICIAIGCTQEKPVRPTVAQIEAGPLSYIRDGQTRRDQITAKLGKPTGEFESRRIVTYHMYCRLDDAFAVQRGGSMSYGQSWGFATHQLVLVFDDRQVLVRHSLIEIRR